METIRNYLDQMLRGIPDTPKIRRAREELLAMMEDKYQELKREGKSENEAIGTVVAEFGDLDEILKNLAPEEETKEEPKEGKKKFFGFSFGRKKEEFRQVGLDEAKEFLEFQERFARGIGLGVFLCILSPALLVFGEGTRLQTTLSFFGLPMLFLCVAAGVGLFIYYGMKNEEYEPLRKEPFVLEEFTGNYVEKLLEDNESLFRGQIILGVMLCILSVVPLLVLESMAVPALEGIGVSALLILVGAGVFCFVHSGIVKGGYDVLLQKGEYKLKKKIKRMNKR